MYCVDVGVKMIIILLLNLFVLAVAVDPFCKSPHVNFTHCIIDKTGSGISNMREKFAPRHRSRDSADANIKDSAILTPTNVFLLLRVVTSVQLVAKIDQELRP